MIRPNAWPEALQTYRQPTSWSLRAELALMALPIAPAVLFLDLVQAVVRRRPARPLIPAVV